MDKCTGYVPLTSNYRYLYNDSMWLSEKLKEFVSIWKTRNDLPPRARGMVRLDLEIKKLESFGKRAYTNELNEQRTIINDLLGGKCTPVPSISGRNWVSNQVTFVLLRI